MRTALALLLVLPSAAVAALPDKTNERPRPSAMLTETVPCLRDKGESRYVVRWVIVNQRTGERRDPGSQEVRKRC